MGTAAMRAQCLGHHLSYSCSLTARSDADTGLESNDEAEVSVLFADDAEDAPQQRKAETGAHGEPEVEVPLGCGAGEAIEPCSPCSSTGAGDIDLRFCSDNLHETLSDEQGSLPPASAPSPAEHGDLAGSAVESTTTANSGGGSAMVVDELPKSSCATTASSAPECGAGLDKNQSSMFYISSCCEAFNR